MGGGGEVGWWWWWGAVVREVEGAQAGFGPGDNFRVEAGRDEERGTVTLNKKEKRRCAWVCSKR